MTISIETEPITPSSVSPLRSGRPPTSTGFDWLMMGVAFFPLVGAMSDAYAHSNFSNLETFFTPWHAILYSGLFIVGVSMFLVVRRNHALGYSWQRAVPLGYELSILGVGVLFVGGIFDLIWHTLFGIERNLDANVSPSHLLIIAGVLLILAGPLRSAFSRRDPLTLKGVQQLPMILSLTFTITMIDIVTQFMQPYIFLFAAHNQDLFAATPSAIDPTLSKAAGVMGFIIQSMILSVFILLAARRWRLLPGTFTFLFTVDIAVISLITGGFDLLPSAVIAGVLIDALFQVLRPYNGNTIAMRLFAFGFPVVLYGCYFVNLLIFQGIVWTIHLWLGTIFLAGVVGWALSYLLIPPQSVSDAVE